MTSGVVWTLFCMRISCLSLRARLLRWACLAPQSSIGWLAGALHLALLSTARRALSRATQIYYISPQQPAMI